MTGLWRGLGANVLAGTRLAFFLPVRASDFRVSAGQYAMIVGASFAAWLLGGMVRGGLNGGLNTGAFVVGLGQLPLVLLACLLAATVLRDGALALALAVLVTSTDPAFEVVATVLSRLSRYEAVADYGGYLNQLYIAWGAITLLRAQYVASGWRGRRSVGAAGVLLASLFVFVFYFQRTELWSPMVEQPAPAAQGLVREEVFHLQGSLLDNQLADLEPERPGVADLYFVGAAPYAPHDGFLKEISTLRRLMDERFDTAGRSIALANHPATLGTMPLATATNLASALGELGDLINPEEDIVFLFLASQGSPAHELAFAMPPLVLQQVNPTVLSRMLADSGIKWRVIVLSACYAGGFIEPLKDDNSLIVTASDATGAGPGCEAKDGPGGFASALEQALRSTRSLPQAFAQAAAKLAEQERAAGTQSSSPQMHFGGAIRDRLESLQRRIESQDPNRPSVRASR